MFDPDFPYSQKYPTPRIEDRTFRHRFTVNENSRECTELGRLISALFESCEIADFSIPVLIEGGQPGWIATERRFTTVKFRGFICGYEVDIPSWRGVRHYNVEWRMLESCGSGSVLAEEQVQIGERVLRLAPAPVAIEGCSCKVCPAGADCCDLACQYCDGDGIEELCGFCLQAQKSGREAAKGNG